MIHTNTAQLFHHLLASNPSLSPYLPPVSFEPAFPHTISLWRSRVARIPSGLGCQRGLDDCFSFLLPFSLPRRICCIVSGQPAAASVFHRFLTADSGALLANENGPIPTDINEVSTGRRTRAFPVAPRLRQTSLKRCHLALLKLPVSYF